MSKKSIDQTTPPDDGTGLRGGTQGGGTAPLGQVLGLPGGTNALTPVGGSHQGGRPPEPPTGDKAGAERQDPKRTLEGGRTTESPDVIAQRARDDAHVEGSVSGVDANSPRQIPENAPTADGRTGND